MKFSWSSIVAYLKIQVPILIKKYSKLFVVKVLGISSSFPAWLVSTGIIQILKEMWREVKPYLEKIAYQLDKNKLDHAAKKEYDKAKEQGMSHEELKKKRLDLINGKSK